MEQASKQPWLDNATSEAVNLLCELIRIPSLSRMETAAADHLVSVLHRDGYSPERTGNNVILYNRNFHPDQPALLLNSHLDTVKPAATYTADPFTPRVESGRITGLGSNDAGGSLVAMLMAFQFFYERPDLPFNLCFVASAEEEISGEGGIQAVLPVLPAIRFALVGEPTSLHLAVAEKGLLVLDAVVHGQSGHAARNEGINAIELALPDIQWFNAYRFPKISEHLGAMKMTVTQVAAGSQHNVIPDTCTFTVDIRCNGCYTHEEILETIRKHVKATVTPRSLRLKPSVLPEQHIIYRIAGELGIPVYGSPTLSDQALMNFPSVKIGPGDSARSHTADEYILVEEIASGIATYIKLIEQLIEHETLG